MYVDERLSDLPSYNILFPVCDQLQTHAILGSKRFGFVKTSKHFSVKPGEKYSGRNTTKRNYISHKR